MKFAILATFNFPITKVYDLRPEELISFLRWLIISKYEAGIIRLETSDMNGATLHRQMLTHAECTDNNANGVSIFCLLH